ncbi:hypothetical protein KJZ99_11835 [bacterium]|nr:hypothetical protein [bacterium]
MSRHPLQDSLLEERLRRSRLLSNEQIELVQELQKESSIGLAQAIVELDLLTQNEVDRIVSSDADIRSIRLEEVTIEPEAIRHVPARVAREFRCIPIKRSGNTLVVAAADPSGCPVRDALRSVTDAEIVLFSADPEAVEHAVFIYYGDRNGGSRGTTQTPQGRKSADHYAHWRVPQATPQTFDTFYDHDGVRSAREIGKQIAAGAAEPIDMPLLFVGESGSGKTHLVKAIQHYMSRSNPLARGLLCSGSEFVDSTLEFLAVREVAYFRYELRDREIVIVDDAGKCFGMPVVEQELSSLCEHYRSSGGVVVLTLAPEDICAGPSTQELRETLSRGTEIELSMPSPSALRDIATKRGVKAEILDDDVMEASVQNGGGWPALRNCLCTK